jgi:hypothetical protein
MRSRVILLIMGLSFLVLLFLVGCEGPAGPQGPTGDKGTDASISESCGFSHDYFLRCHGGDTDTTYRVAAKEVQYEMSGHRELGNYDRNTTTCAGCHTNEGFVERYNRGFANETFSLNAASGPIVYQTYANSSPVGCFTCHLPHIRGNFTVRDSGAVNIFTLVAGQTTKVWNSTPSSNLCVKCHQPRMTSTPLIGSTPSWQPDPTKTALTDTAKILTVRYNNHVSGENVQNLLGFGGVEFSGYSYTNYANSYGHTNLVKSGLLGCEDCHMATPIGNKGGGHTFKIGYVPEGSTTESFNFAGCNVTGCHGSGGVTTGATDAHWTLIRNEIQGKRAQLAQLLMDTTISAKWGVVRKLNGKAVPFIGWNFNAAGDTIYYALAGKASGTIYYDKSGNAYSSAADFGTLKVVPAFKAGAIWNLQQVLYDPSLGIHNYRYVRDLLNASIAELNK